MKEQLLILDGGGVGHDIEWPDFGALGDVTSHDQTPAAETAGRIAGATAVFTNKTVLTAEAINGAQNLRYIGCLATGFNHVDLEAARKRGVTVTNVPDYSSAAVAQHVFAMLLEFTNQVDLHDKAVQDGEWVKSKYFCFWKRPILELEGKTMGIVGFGNIGRRVAHLAEAFGMRVIAYAPRPKESPPYPGFAFASLEELFSQSDFISLHTPLTPENEGMVNKKLLGLMKKSAYIINTARGQLINESDLAEAVKNGQIAGAGLDVVRVEPMADDNILRGLPGVLITPHMAWASVEARTRLMRLVYENYQAFLNGKPLNVVNGL
jgi:glycerate dehydrogenase